MLVSTMKVLATGHSKIQTHLNMYVSSQRSGTRKESSVFRTIRRSPRLVANGAAMVSLGKHSLTRESVLLNHGWTPHPALQIDI